MALLIHQELNAGQRLEKPSLILEKIGDAAGPESQLLPLVPAILGVVIAWR